MHRFFASDNGSGIHPNIIEAIAQANVGHTKGYGYDAYTRQAEEDFRRLFGAQVNVFFVYSGTGANVLSLQSCLQSFEAVVCSDVAHIHTDETGAPEYNLGVKLIALPSVNGKISVDQLDKVLIGRGVEHHVQPKVISLTQSTEYGTVYNLEEVQAISAFCRQHDLYLHMDGARIANALASLNISPAEFFSHAGVDILSFGGTKNGMMLGEAVVVFREELARTMKYRRKQSLQLYSKMRFMSAQFSAYFHNNLWLDLARHSNAMAQYLEASLRSLGDSVVITKPVEANGVFCIFPSGIEEQLMSRFPFYYWSEEIREIRLMCSWDTTTSDIDTFISEARTLLSGR